MNRIPTHHTDMEFVDIPGTSIRASRVALGTWAIGGWMWGGSNESDAIATIHAALDRGINLIDTAPVYGFGRSEEIVGKALAEGGRRKRVYIATKVGLDWKDGKPFRNASKARIVEEAEASLRRLKTDVIDLYQVHWPDPNTPIAEVAEAMGELHRTGKIRAIGVSNFSPAQMKEFRKVAPLHTAQPPYNLFERSIEDDVLPYARARNVAVLAYGSLCRGLLSGSMSRSTRFTGDDLRKSDPKFREPRYAQYLAAVEKSGPARASAIRQARHPSRRALGARSRGSQHRPVGRAARRPARADRRRRRLAHRRGRDGGDRPDSQGDDPRSRRPRIHGPSGSPGGLIEPFISGSFP